MINEYPFFPAIEHQQRIEKVRAVLDEWHYDALLVTSPENIYYLTGLSHQGYFTYTGLVVPIDKPPVLVARDAERRTVGDQVPWLDMVGYAEHQQPADVTVQALRDLKLLNDRLALEKDHLFFPPIVSEQIAAAVPGSRTADGSGIVERLTWVKSDPELEYVRRAAGIGTATMSAAIDAVSAGREEREVVAAAYAAMLQTGGEIPGHAPFVRSNETIPQSHTSWRNRSLADGDVLFMELAGCVARYHAPITRQAFVGAAPPGIDEAAALASSAHEALLKALRPGSSSRDAYWAYQGTIDAGLGHDRYRRIHCGYLVGIGFPPSWSGGARVQGIRPDYDFEILPGMVFHLWADTNGSGMADFIYSDTAAITTEGCEVLTDASRRPIVKESL